jgi:two-component system cell cycle sensor histidine kinase/response regulator CckA
MHSTGNSPESNVRALGGIQNGTRAAGAGEPGHGMAATILVVDDDDPVRVMLARLLRTQGYAVVQAAHATEARVQLDARPLDLVISDIVMPGESGIELRRTILERWPDLPVILISGYSAEGPAEFAARTPNTLFVQKPFAADQFLSLVEQALTGSPAS